jgi:hypothetical protein
MTGTRRSSEWSCGEALEEAARYVTALRQPGGRARAAASRPGAAALVGLLRSLPVVRAPFSPGPAGRELRSWFGEGQRLPFARVPVAVLELPPSFPEYTRGRARQALRTNLRRAQEAGAACLPEPPPAELRRAIEHLAARRGQAPGHMVPEQRRPGVRRRFSLAYDAAGDPVGLSEVVVDDGWAGMGVLVTASGHEHAPAVRYLLHAHTVERLIAGGVGMLAVSGSMLLTSAGTRYFQQRTGFAPVWLRPVRIPRAQGSEGGAALAGAQLGHVAVRGTGGLGGVGDRTEVPGGGQPALEGVQRVDVRHLVPEQRADADVQLAVQPVVGALPDVEGALVGRGEVVERHEDAGRVRSGRDDRGQRALPAVLLRAEGQPPAGEPAGAGVG